MSEERYWFIVNNTDAMSQTPQVAVYHACVALRTDHPMLACLAHDLAVSYGIVFG